MTSKLQNISTSGLDDLPNVPKQLIEDKYDKRNNMSNIGRNR